MAHPNFKGNLKGGPPFGLAKGAGSDGEAQDDIGGRLSKMKGGDKKKAARSDAIQRRLAMMRKGK